ncbi:hypothetical protein C8R46DRAFT_433339 [Mycena filopes]|nr:hypothetical protein C8R46DRAFT_433339 [Mycena filopes]
MVRHLWLVRWWPAGVSVFWISLTGSRASEIQSPAIRGYRGLSPPAPSASVRCEKALSIRVALLAGWGIAVLPGTQHPPAVSPCLLSAPYNVGVSKRRGAGFQLVAETTRLWPQFNRGRRRGVSSRLCALFNLFQLESGKFNQPTDPER